MGQGAGGPVALRRYRKVRWDSGVVASANSQYEEVPEVNGARGEVGAECVPGG